MEPTEEFWGGIGTSVSTAEGWIVVAAITLVTLVIGTLFVVAKYIYPGHKELMTVKERNARELKERELDIREHEMLNDEERIKANAAMAEQMAALRSSNEQIAQRFVETSAGIEESKTRSREMGSTVEDTNRTAHSIEDTTKDSNRKITEIHVQMHDLYGMLNNREEKL